MTADVRLEPWSDAGFDLLRRCNTPGMTTHLGGPESEQKLLFRHQRYLGYARAKSAGDDPGAWPYRVFVGDEVAASIAYWRSEWDGLQVFEAGWATVPEFQGHGVATAAVRLVLAEAAGRHESRWVVAMPSRENPGSNGVCRSAGFEYFGECEVEYPPGTSMAANDWRFDLGA